ncbi:hypothetical protein E1176_06255 [Fulvivirga sp. RKSG066]|uniref:hypothetical protein n=1 Tax=Fulvivirga aurantia TaxID=2529383 RepID=UPI0012BD277D|nr:hypothetical protein [Fulvivirga aurantia]MTI20617.1 hypothetical protein [Fulvivirga aurantia]
MKVTVLSCLVLFITSACEDQGDISKMTSDRWSITWQLNNNTTQGEIYLSDNNQATVVIKEADHFFFNEAETVDFLWYLNDQTLTLQRKDNGFIMDYKIVEKQENQIKLAYEDLNVKIYR